MEKFKKLFIRSVDGDVTIREGSSLEILGSYYIENECLHIAANNDATIRIPYGQYQEIKIQTVSGDCLIDLSDSKVERIVVSTVSGDLTVQADCRDISFDSVDGDYYRKRNSAPTNQKMTTKTVKTVSTKEEPIYIGNERYR